MDTCHKSGDTLQGEVHNLRDEISELKGEITRLESAIADHDEDVEVAAGAEVTELQTRLNNLHLRNTNLEGAVTGLANDVEQAHATREATDSTNIELAQLVDDLQVQNTSNERLASDRLERIHQLEMEVKKSEGVSYITSHIHVHGTSN